MPADFPSPDRTSPHSDLFLGKGEMAAHMRNLDWHATPLGDPQAWPLSLKSTVRMLLTSRYAMWMAWGRDLSFLYNDAYTPTLGVKHPWAIARPAHDVWKEIWADIGPLVDQVISTGEAIFNKGLLLFLERSGFPEETYHTFSYSPLFGDDGGVGGMLCVVVEETDRVLNERRLDTLREFATAAAAVTSESGLFELIERTLGKNLKDLPFTLTYLNDADGQGARRVALSGITDDHAAAPERIDPAAGHWPFQEVSSGQALLVGDLATRFGDVPAEGWPTGGWDRPAEKAIVVPIGLGAEKAAAGYFVVGLNPYRRDDENLVGFINLLAGQIGSALAGVRAYEEERKRAEALAEIDRAKTLFFSNVSHEFRTPLTLMLGPLEDVLANPAEDNARAQVELAHRNGMRLLRLVNSLLEFSRIEAGRVQAAYEPTDIARLSTDIASSFRSAVERAGLALRIDAEPLAEPVYLDHDMWEKVLLNLLSNAFKFTFEGEIAVVVSAGDDGKTAVIEVRDTGIGIPEHEVPRLFERFRRIEGAQGRSFEGSGIGLALVRELVTLHGGDISAGSRPGRGTVFTIRLPFGAAHLPPEHVREGRSSTKTGSANPFVEEALRWIRDDADDASSSGIGSVAAPDMEAGAGKTIILADDNADMRDYVRRLLEGKGYRVLAFENGSDALDAARTARPDLILSDVMMPKLDGFGLLRALRGEEALAGVPVILLSARAGEEAKVEGLDAGADDYLVKPFAARELLARVNTNIQMAAVRRDAERRIIASEQKYLMSSERLNMALSTGRVSVFEWDIGGDRLVIEGPLAQLFGVDVAAAEHGLPLEVFLSGIEPDDLGRTIDAINTSVATGAPYETEYRTRGNGEVRTILARGQVAGLPGGGRRMSGVLIDLTQEKAAEQALRQKQAELEDQTRALMRAEADLHALNNSLEERVEREIAERSRVEEALRQAQKMEAVGQLTGGVAHDFNNLLTVIIGGLDTIKRAKPEDSGRILRSADMALQGAQRAANLTGRLLAFSRRQPLMPRPLDLNVLVRDMTELLHRTLGEHIELEGVLAPRLWPVEADQNQLESAIINLAVNARDAMPEGGRLTLETANTALDEAYASVDSEVIPGQYVAISVSDTGHGMTKETVARVFEPFFTTKEVGRGTGLGLSQVYGFVKQSGGHVTVYSEPGHGTTVKMYFPRYFGDTPGPVEAAEADVPTSSDGEVILLVEDNSDVRVYSASILSELGYEVLEAAEAGAALAILASARRIDLLFTDVVLPGRSGRVLADEAARLRPGLKILFTTGYSRNAIVHHGRLDPGVQLISKPFTFEQLGTRVRDVLDQA